MIGSVRAVPIYAPDHVAPTNDARSSFGHHFAPSACTDGYAADSNTPVKILKAINAGIDPAASGIIAVIADGINTAASINLCAPKKPAVHPAGICNGIYPIKKADDKRPVVALSYLNSLAIEIILTDKITRRAYTCINPVKRRSVITFLFLVKIDRPSLAGVVEEEGLESFSISSINFVASI